jgi:pyruvate-formate lyase-activating enzyme
MAQYPDYELYLTVDSGNLQSVTEQLLVCGIPKERIHYCENDVVWRRGCKHLGHRIVVSSGSIRACCASYVKSFKYSTTIHTRESVKECLQEFRQWLNRTIEDCGTDRAVDCDGCGMLKWGCWPKEPKIKALNAGAGFANTICNCKCIYCLQEDSVFTGSNQTLDGYDIYKILFDEFGDSDSIEWFALADGEITVLPHRDKLLKLILDKGCKAHILTNALLYNDHIAQVLNRRGSALNVSLDAGTDETYRKIKGVDALPRVMANIKRYAETKGRIVLKYIFLPGINDNFSDVNGFINFAKNLKVSSIYLSQDLKDIAKIRESTEPTKGNISEQEFAMYAYFAARCKEAGLAVYYVFEQFTANDCLRMNNVCAPI